MLSVTESWQNVSAIYQQPQLYIFPGLLYLVGLTNTVAIRKATPSESQRSYKSKTIVFVVHKRAILNSRKNIVILYLQ